MNPLLKAFQQIGQLAPEHGQALLATAHRKQVPAKTQLTEAGKTANAIWFVEQGLARTYYYKDGRDITYWIAAEKDFVGSMGSFFMRQPGNKCVETLENSILWEFDHARMENLFAKSMELQRAGRLFANYGLAMMEQRFDDLHFHSAKDRYEILLRRQPGILNRVPLGMIATFLGITQETLSRIRSHF